jgi:type I restriction enzyme S subunit
MGTVDLYELAQATTVPSLRKADLELLEIPLPPLAEQRRIVAKLDELLASSRAARAALDAVPALLEQYRQAVLAAAFRGDLTTDWRGDQTEQLSEDVAWVLRAYANEHEAMPSLPSSWRYVPVESVAEPGTVVTYGIILPGPDVPDGVPYVRQQDIEDGRVRLDALGRTSHAIAAKHARSALREGDVLLCIIRHLRVAVVPPGIDGANITQGAVRIRPAPFITADYLATYLSSPAPQEWMKRCYIGMAMPRINVKDARAVPVAVPPLPEQHEIMRRVADVLSTVERQLAAVREMQRALDDLEKATLAKAFCGELVPQDPADESASALLARLRAERASATGDRPRRRAPVRA